ncbi:integrase [Kitasatospora sp. NPDC091257]|uniref:integrase n=1 Tax=Kitasatospora sp. NPDC091257 TaxID=3364084 RepID=UPI0037F144F6
MTSTALTLAEDPYVLRAPLPDDPVVLPQWVSPGNTQASNRVRDDIWSLGPLIDQPGQVVSRIHWKSCPAPLRDELRTLAWTLLNGVRRPTVVQESRGRGTRLGTRRAVMLVWMWQRWARWLHRHGVHTFADVTSEHWRAFAASLQSREVDRSTIENYLSHLSDLWEYDQLTARPAGIIRPPWDTEGIDDYLPAEKREGGRENTAEPLDPSVVGPLMVWAIRLVEDLADDILTAWDERTRITFQARSNRATLESRAALDTYVQKLLADGAPLPTATVRGNTGLARLYVADRTGCSKGQVDGAANKYGLARLAAERPGPCPMTTPITGLIDGQPWRVSIGFDEAEDLRRHLSTAAAVIIMYLTGMRPQEVQALRSGCCPDPVPVSDGTTRHLIHSEVTGPAEGENPDTGDDENADGFHLITGHHYKSVRDDDNNHISAGEIRTVPWVAITPVVRAIRVLERMVPPGELLLSSAHHDSGKREHHGSLTLVALAARIKELVAWINQEAAAQGLPGQTVPADPRGPISPGRWRRTLAWHIARRPGGLVALAIQYGHMRAFLDARTSAGYGARGRRGMHGVLDVETVLATADAAANLRDAATAGERISGPAAGRALIDAANTPRFEGALLTARATRQLNQMRGHLLYDNPDSFLICAFKEDTALCEPDAGAIAPLPFACQTGCGNAVRTDAHAQAAQAHADRLEQQAAHVPGPMAKALHVTAAKWRGVADTHHVTARTAQEVLG